MTGRTPSKTIPAERCLIADAVAIVGVPKRTLQALAARGEISGAAIIGRRWTFDIDALRAYVRERELASCHSDKPHPSPPGGGPRPAASTRPAALRSDGAYERAMERLRRGGGKGTGSGK
jgi:hypothetical protein